MASCYARRNKMHGGSCLFVRRDVLFVEMVDLKEKSVETVIECSAVEIPEEELILINLFRPPTGDVTTFFDVFIDIMAAVTDKNRKLWDNSDRGLQYRFPKLRARHHEGISRYPKFL